MQELKEFREFIAESKYTRLSDKDLAGSIQSLINSKKIRITKESNIFKIKWNDANDAIFLSNDPKSSPKNWEAGLLDIVNGKGFAVTVWDGIPKELKAAIQAANKERRFRKFDSEEQARSKRNER